MNQNGPIVIVEDDPDDRGFLQEIFEELKFPNELKIFSAAEQAFEYIHQEHIYPFLVLSDINMPGMSGFELRSQIKRDPDLDVKCIPYIFLTTGATRDVVVRAYELSVQGIFQKPAQLGKWKELMRQIAEYWKECMSPRRF